MLQIYMDAASHYKESWQNAQKIRFNYPAPENIILAGMGGSAIGGEIFKDYTRQAAKVPLEISRDYTLPAYAGKHSLVVCASYSGDTEETLSAFLDAYRRKCKIFCISSGGALIKYAAALSVPYLQVRGGMQPRAAMPHMLMPLLKCAQKLRLSPQIADDFSEALTLLSEVSVQNGPVMSVTQNPAKSLAKNLNGVCPVVYGFGIFRGVALRCKQQFNENAKVPAKWETFSELNHNETMGWESARELADGFGVVFLRDKNEPMEINTRIETTKALMQPHVAKIFEVWAQGKSPLAKILSTILLVDFASVYLAYLRGVDPTPVDTVSTMKANIERNGVKKKILTQLDGLTGHAK